MKLWKQVWKAEVSLYLGKLRISCNIHARTFFLQNQTIYSIIYLLMGSVTDVGRLRSLLVMPFVVAVWLEKYGPAVILAT